MSWIQILNELTQQRNHATSVEFYPAALERDMILAEKKLNMTFPPDLKGLYAETNGVGLRLICNHPLDDVLIGYWIWPLEWVLVENIKFRAENPFKRIYNPFNHLLFFSDAGNGDQYGYHIENQQAVDQIFRWDHEDDSRICIAHSLREFLEKA